MAIFAAFLGNARAGRPGGIAEPLSLRAGLGGTAVEGVGADRPGGAGAARRGGDDAMVGAGKSGPGAARQPGVVAAAEVVTCGDAPQFADFVLRWQGLHPDERRGQSEGLAEALERLQGMPLDAEVWEQFVLPARVPGYQPRWLDEWVIGGSGVWVGQGDEA